MSHTIIRPRRFGRLAAGLSVVAAAATTTLLTAAPAYAQPPTTNAGVNRGGLTIFATNAGEFMTATVVNGAVVLNSNGSINAKQGCTPITGTSVRCTGVNRLIEFNGFGGNDTFFNNTSVPGLLVGGSGSDRLNGGSANDRIDGDSEFDFAVGNGGFDTCSAESESTCEA
jgi:hypothetical protein